MPHIEYRCSQCDHRFERVVFLGDEEDQTVCPLCGSADVRKPSTASSPFNGISPFSRLASDRD